MALSIYTRGKNEAGRWRYTRIKEGRGKKTGEFVAPFFVRPMVAGKQIWKPLVAENFTDARMEADKMVAGLEARAQGSTVAEFRDDGDRLPLAKAVHDFIVEAARKKKPKTLIGYKLNLKQFLESAKSLYFLDEVTKHTIRQFRDYLLEKGYEPRTLHNRVMTVLSMLKEHKIQTGFSLANDLPTFEEEPPVAFTDEDLKKLFASMDAEDMARYKFILGTAAREQEAQYASWTDIDFERKEFHIRPKQDVGFTPKNHEKRTVPMPDSLVNLLKERKKNAPHSRWLFVNRNEKPDGHLLKKLKRLALHAGLNCGECTTTMNKGRYDRKPPVEVTCKTDPICKPIFLHRLRKTCATRWEAAGIPVSKIQLYLGHESLDTTQRYLGGTDSSKFRSNINQAFSGSD
jgi:integrase